MKTIKTVKLNAKLVFKNFLKADALDRLGIIFLLGFIVPIVLAVLVDVFNNGSKML
tara:strand:- start:263 stop:430 length:168 start_codon:yes stop_codon:yes gene_type:complete